MVRRARIPVVITHAKAVGRPNWGRSVAMLAAPAGFASDAHHTIVPADTVKWGPAPPSLPAGAQASVRRADPLRAMKVRRVVIPQYAHACGGSDSPCNPDRTLLRD